MMCVCVCVCVRVRVYCDKNAIILQIIMYCHNRMNAPGLLLRTMIKISCILERRLMIFPSLFQYC